MSDVHNVTDQPTNQHVHYIEVEIWEERWGWLKNPKYCGHHISQASFKRNPVTRSRWAKLKYDMYHFTLPRRVTEPTTARRGRRRFSFLLATGESVKSVTGYRRHLRIAAVGKDTDEEEKEEKEGRHGWLSLTKLLRQRQQELKVRN